MSGDVEQLPAAFFALVPELRTLAFPAESKSTCGACPMVKEGFDPITRCCTYHPDLPNFLVGRALLRGGPGAEALRARMTDLDGVEARGVGNTTERRKRYVEADRTTFGKPGRERCPYWVDGDLSCSVWHDRGAICRTWHCKHDRGLRGHRAWMALRDVLSHVERLLADWCVATGSPPLAMLANRDDWEAWFRGCAEAVDGLALAGSLSDAKLQGARIALLHHVARREAPLPERIAQAARDAKTDGGRLRLSSHSPYDYTDVTPDVLVLLTCVGDGRPWRDAVRDAEAILGHAVDTSALDVLWHAGLLLDADAESDDPDPPPEDLFGAGS